MNLAAAQPAVFAALVALAEETGSLLGSNSADQWTPGDLDLRRLLGPMALLIGMLLLVITTARLRRRRREVEQNMRRTAARPGTGGGQRDALERMALDLEEVARSISAMLDTRMRMLERLIRDADERLARLEEASRAAGGGAVASAPPAEAAAEDAAPRRPADRELLEHHAGIFRLADQGLSVHQIADQIGCPHGEVELVLSLRRAAGGAPEAHREPDAETPES